MAKEKEVMEKITQVEEGDECHHPDPRDWQFVKPMAGHCLWKDSQAGPWYK